jgi:hypothetical protein
VKKILILLALLAGCSKPDFKTRYAVVSSFNETVLETDDKTQAYETAHSLTLMGRTLASKPAYFVLENPR